MLTTCAVSHIPNSDKGYVPAECSGPRPVVPDELIPWISNPHCGAARHVVAVFSGTFFLSRTPSFSTTPLGLDTHFAPTTPHPASTSCFGASHRLSLLGSLARKPHTITPCEAVSPALAAHVPPGRYRSWAEALRTCPNVSPSFLLLIRTTCIVSILRVTQSIASVSPYRVTSDVQRSSRWPRVFTGLLRTRCLEAILANQNTALDVNGKYCRRLYR